MAGLLEVNLDQINRGIVSSVTADNATATATLPAVAGKCNVLRHVYVSYSAAAAAGSKVIVKFGSTTKVTQYVGAALGIQELDFGEAGIIDLTVNEAITAVLDASGTGGIVGSVTIDGYPTDAPY